MGFARYDARGPFIMSPGNVFDSIESAQEYVALLCEALDDAAGSIQTEIESPVAANHRRHLDALHLVDYKLKSLQQHFVASRLLLNDLRTLRRYLLDERVPEVVEEESGDERTQDDQPDRRRVVTSSDMDT